jgi:hypothetical protein
MSRREARYVNILTPSTLVGGSALYLPPLLYTHLFQTAGTRFAYVYISLTIAVLFYAILVRFLSCFGATKIYQERIATTLPGVPPHVLLLIKKAGETC